MMETGWGVVHTEPTQELAAERAIRDLGYQPWLPMYRKVLRCYRIDAASGKRVRTRKAGEVVERPLIRGYLFVAIPHGDYATGMDHCDGVKRLFRHQPEVELGWGRPKYVRALEVERLRQAVDDGIYDEVREDRLRTDLAIGETVRTPAGIAGRLLALDDKGRAELFVAEFMGRDKVIRGVDARTLEPVG